MPPKNRELQIMRKLDHCNIVRLRYFFYSSGEKVRPGCGDSSSAWAPPICLPFSWLLVSSLVIPHTFLPLFLAHFS